MQREQSIGLQREDSKKISTGSFRGARYCTIFSTRPLLTLIQGGRRLVYLTHTSCIQWLAVQRGGETWIIRVFVPSHRLDESYSERAMIEHPYACLGRRPWPGLARRGRSMRCCVWP
jgi:hypothetical protein